MGYYTEYKLETHDSALTITDIFANLGDWEFPGLNYVVDANGETCNSAKWYEHERDMVDLSLKFPNIIFKLSGEGEDKYDIWIKCFCDGEIQTCNALITYDECEFVVEHDELTDSIIILQEIIDDSYHHNLLEEHIDALSFIKNKIVNTII